MPTVRKAPVGSGRGPRVGPTSSNAARAETRSRRCLWSSAAVGLVPCRRTPVAALYYGLVVTVISVALAVPYLWLRLFAL
jgi:hypothetical protein